MPSKKTNFERRFKILKLIVQGPVYNVYFADDLKIIPRHGKTAPVVVKIMKPTIH
jgi:hypothetical protein